MLKRKQENLTTFWRHHVESRRLAGLSRAEYCRRHNLSAHQMGYWQTRLSKVPQLAGEPQPLPMNSFAQAIVLEPANPMGILTRDSDLRGFRLDLRDGLVLELTGGVDAKWLAKFVSEVRRGLA